MTVRKSNLRQFGMEAIYLENLVPQDHLVRKLQDAIDWQEVRKLALPYYSDKGRMAIDPEVLFKLIVIKYVFGIKSMRRTCKECEVNIAYRWFLGLNLSDSIPNYSTWSKNYERRFQHTPEGGQDIFHQIFSLILEQCAQEGFLNLTSVYGDSTHQKASANKNKYTSAEVAVAAKHYEKELTEEINAQRIADGKKPFKEIAEPELAFDETTGEEIEVPYQGETKTIKQSTTDPESGLFHKGEKEKCFAYAHSIFTDKNGFVLTVDTNPGNVHDSVAFFTAFNSLMNLFPYSENKWLEIKNVVLDAGYKSPAICKTIEENGLVPLLPYKRPGGKKGNFKVRNDFHFNPEEDVFICPAGHKLTYRTTNRKGFREYRSDVKLCKDCPFREKCTASKNCQKTILRHVWAQYMDLAELIRHTPLWKREYPIRKTTVERVFAEAKENMGLRYTRVRGLKRNGDAARMLFACCNLKKLALFKERRTQFEAEKASHLENITAKLKIRMRFTLINVISPGFLV